MRLLRPSERLADRWTGPWFDFDDDADVLYVSFERPQGATDSELTDDGVILRDRGEQLVGVTILNVSKRIAQAH